MKVVLYARVSSDRQAEKELSISAQLKALRKYAEDRDWKIYEEFVDEAESARTANRPAFQKIIAKSKQTPKPFDAILVWKLSRFARNREDSIIYKSLLRKRGVSVISINEPIDESPTGRLIEGVLEVLDEFYSLNLAQDTKRGMKENTVRGFCNGGQAPVGYKKVRIMDGRNERSKLELDEILAPIIQRIFQMGIDGMGAKEIVNTLNREGIRTNLGKVWNKNLIYAIWRNERYTGTQLWNETSRSQGKKANPEEEIVRYPDCHPAIIDYETFHKMQDIREERSPQRRFHPRELGSEYLLSGLIICKKCGGKMIGHAAKSSTVFLLWLSESYEKGENRMRCQSDQPK